jgi:hypothetical protein
MPLKSGFRILKDKTSPASKGGLTYWFDSTERDTLTFNGSNISYIEDKSGNGNDISQATAVNQPLYVEDALNGSPILEFNGDNLRSVGTITQPELVENGKSYTMFCVFKQISNGSSGAHIFEWITAGGLEALKLALYNLGSRTLVQCGNTTSNVGRIISNTKPSDRDSTYYITKVKRDVDTIEVKWYNQGLKLTMAETTLTDSLSTGTQNFIIDPIGRFGESFHYNRALSSQEDTDILTGLANKWGL